MEATANFSLSVYSILIKNKKKTQSFFIVTPGLARSLKKKKQTGVFFFPFSRIRRHEIGKLRIG